MSSSTAGHRIVIVGGGAGGLELATRLGRSLGKRGRAQVTLVDASLTHIWKPLLHEVAAGTLDSGEDALDYLSQAQRHHFRYQYGRMIGLDRERKAVRLAPFKDTEGREVVPERDLEYDTLVIAVGSVSNHFGTPGAAEHCLYLDDSAQAERFQQMLVKSFLRAQVQETAIDDSQLSVAIVGGGATGVELAAELRNAARKAVGYGLDRIDPETDLRLTVIEAADRVLPALSPGLSIKTRKQLDELGVKVMTGSKVTEVNEKGMLLESGDFIPAHMRVWSAGVKGPDWLSELGDLETNRSNQLVINEYLQTTADNDIYAIGDCASLVLPGHDAPLPPRAQTASQQASYLNKALGKRLRGQQPDAFTYKDYGSLISLSEDHAVGRLMGGLFGSLMLEGMLARGAYNMLYRKHLAAVHGLFRMLVLITLHGLFKRTRPRLKLH